MPGRANLKGYLKAFKRQRTKAFGQYKHLDKNPDIVTLFSFSFQKMTSSTAELSSIWPPQEDKFFNNVSVNRNYKLKTKTTMTRNDYTTVCPYHNTLSQISLKVFAAIPQKLLVLVIYIRQKSFKGQVVHYLVLETLGGLCIRS